LVSLGLIVAGLVIGVVERADGRKGHGRSKDGSVVVAQTGAFQQHKRCECICCLIVRAADDVMSLAELSPRGQREAPEMQRQWLRAIPSVSSGIAVFTKHSCNRRMFTFLVFLNLFREKVAPLGGFRQGLGNDGFVNPSQKIPKTDLQILSRCLRLSRGERCERDGENDELSDERYS
jgi:hypothetical protein